ncbi:hypothetical protein [Roseovarius sp. 2305UL8-3]|uniref:hypothetical protein n=1 Tax=Roseovarius conchicola TaxID=3121636 RepID=UPI003529D246
MFILLLRGREGALLLIKISALIISTFIALRMLDQLFLEHAICIVLVVYAFRFVREALTILRKADHLNDRQRDTFAPRTATIRKVIVGLDTILFLCLIPTVSSLLILPDMAPARAAGLFMGYCIGCIGLMGMINHLFMSKES